MSPVDGRSPEPLVEQLSRREREILALLAQGYSGPEMAGKLNIALSSVRSHLQHLYSKLGVNRKSGALNRARALGLLETSPAASTFQLPPTGAPAGPAPRHNLPMELTRFFGREPEIAQVRELLAEYRLVTVTGPGGVGKSRLSLRVGEEVLEDFLDGVWFVELASLSDPALVAPQVGMTLGVREIPGRPILEALIGFLRERQILLLLDNCEHLLAACARLADALLRACPRLTILASSREPLGGAGEAIFAAPSLPFPDPGQILALADAVAFPSMRLFVDRARMVQSSYLITPNNVVWLARICQRLDGVPLALEMAAARTNLLTAEQLAARLDDAFHVLTSGHRNALPRQQTLRATIDWSYGLLNKPERLLLQRLSVFAGGCTLEAAEAVCAGAGLEASQVLDVLASLVAKSMVIAGRRQGEETRYRLLETVRQYAVEKLEEAGDNVRVRSRHRDNFVLHAEMAGRMFLASDCRVWDRKLQAEQDNTRLALEWSFSTLIDPADVDAGPRLIIGLEGYAMWTPTEWLDWCNKAIAWCQSHQGIPPVVYARLFGCTSNWTGRDDLERGIAGLEEAVALSRRLGPEGRITLMDNLVTLGENVASQDEIERARAAYAEAEAILQDLGPRQFRPGRYRHYQARFGEAKARLANKQGRHMDAKIYATESVQLDAANGQPASFSSLTQLGKACLKLGEYDQAREYFLNAPVWAHEVMGSYPENSALVYIKRCLGEVDLMQGNLDRALVYCQESLRAAKKGIYRYFIASGVALVSGISAKQGHAEQAARLSGAAQALYASTGRVPWEDSSLDTLLPGWREGPNAAAITRAFDEGQAMSADAATAYALGDNPA